MIKVLFEGGGIAVVLELVALYGGGGAGTGCLVKDVLACNLCVLSSCEADAA